MKRIFATATNPALWLVVLAAPAEKHSPSQPCQQPSAHRRGRAGSQGAGEEPPRKEGARPENALLREREKLLPPSGACPGSVSTAQGPPPSAPRSPPFPCSPRQLRALLRRGLTALRAGPGVPGPPLSPWPAGSAGGRRRHAGPSTPRGSGRAGDPGAEAVGR